jgi:hypothetical protein
LLARKHNTYVVLAPINLFSDTTSGTLGSCFSKYDDMSYHLAILSFKERILLENHHIISTACGVNNMEQMIAINKESKQSENGLIGSDRLTVEPVIIKSLMSAFLGDNPGQSALCSLRGTSTWANCRKCLRQKINRSINLGYIQKSKNIYIIAIE